MTAYHVLTTWQRPPGSDSVGVIDYDRMKVWINEAQRLLDIEDRREVGDRHIGQVLSAAAPDPTDGIAPPIPIRRLLEEGQTLELESGLGSGLLMGPTDVTGGLVSELIAESQQGQQQARSAATAVAARWPKAGRLLRQVADGHAQDARDWQHDPVPLD